MARPDIPKTIIVDQGGDVIGIINRDPLLVDPHSCVHEPAPGQPAICNCVHDWAITGPVGVFNADTGSNDAYWGNMPKPIDQQGLPK